MKGVQKFQIHEVYLTKTWSLRFFRTNICLIYVYTQQFSSLGKLTFLHDKRLLLPIRVGRSNFVKNLRAFLLNFQPRAQTVFTFADL